MLPHKRAPVRHLGCFAQVCQAGVLQAAGTVLSGREVYNFHPVNVPATLKTVPRVQSSRGFQKHGTQNALACTRKR